VEEERVVLLSDKRPRRAGCAAFSDEREKEEEEEEEEEEGEGLSETENRIAASNSR